MSCSLFPINFLQFTKVSNEICDLDLEVPNVANIKCPNALGHFIFATFKTSRSTKNVTDFICDFLKLKEDVLFTLLIFGAKDVENFMQRRAGEQMEQNPLMEAAAAGATSQEFYTLLPLAKLGQNIQPTSSIFLFFNLYCSVLLRGIQYI